MWSQNKSKNKNFKGNIYLLSFFFVLFWATPGGFQNLLLAHSSGTAPGRTLAPCVGILYKPEIPYPVMLGKLCSARSQTSGSFMQSQRSSPSALSWVHFQALHMIIWMHVKKSAKSLTSLQLMMMCTRGQEETQCHYMVTKIIFPCIHINSCKTKFPINGNYVLKLNKNIKTVYKNMAQKMEKFNGECSYAWSSNQNVKNSKSYLENECQPLLWRKSIPLKKEVTAQWDKTSKSHFW